MSDIEQASNDALHLLLMKFALWLDPAWDENNSDDCEAASRAASTFLEEWR